ncbi:unnamed protein product [Withania somnifera]
MGVRSMKRNLIPQAKILTAKTSGVMQFYHCSEQKAFSKLTKLRHLLKNVDLVDGKLVNVNDHLRVYDEILEQKMSSFKSLAWTFIRCPSMQEMMKKSVVQGFPDVQCDQSFCFSKASERESITVDSLTKVSDFLNISAQQRKLLRQSICAQVTKYPIWTGAVEEILYELKSDIDFINCRCPNKEIRMAQQLVTTCEKFSENATSYDPESTSWMRLAPAKGVESPVSHKWEGDLEMLSDLINFLNEETKLTSGVKKLEVIKEGLYQIRDVFIDKNIGYKDASHQEICGGFHVIGCGDKFFLYMGKILTSCEHNMLQSGVKKLSRALGLYKFVWETTGMKGDLEVQGHLWCISSMNKSFTYRTNLFLLHSISC